MRARQSRRWFLRAASATPLAVWLTSAERAEAGDPPPQRFMLMLRPNGTIRSDWVPTGSATSFTLPSITSAFEGVRSSMVVVDGIKLVNSNGGASTHEGGMNTLLTGSPVNGTRPAPNDWKNTAASIDQTLLAPAPPFKGRQALYLAADNRVDNATPQVANRAIAYSGADQPIYPELKPSLVYARLFSTMMPGGQAALLKARARKQSVLDFVKSDLANLTALAPVSQRPRLDQHGAVIRDLEKMLDTAAPTTACTQPAAPTDIAPNVDAAIGPLGALHLSLVQAAFACDLTRVVFFMWNAAASSAVWEGLFPGMPRYNHHALSHMDLASAPIAKAMSAIDRWFADRTATFVTNLKNTPEGTGTLLDNTLVMYTSEVSDGTHSYTNMPITLFGGPGVHLQGGRFLVEKDRSMNDLWLAIAAMYGSPVKTLGAAEQSTGALTDLFA
jgi:Protein of unknown function (DUF1552)